MSDNETITMRKPELIALLFAYYRFGRLTATKQSDAAIAKLEQVMDYLPKLQTFEHDPLFNPNATNLFIDDAFKQLDSLPKDEQGVSKFSDEIATFYKIVAEAQERVH